MPNIKARKLKISILCIGKTAEPQWKSTIEFYEKRLKPFANVQFNIIAPPKRNIHTAQSSILEKEGVLLLNRMKPGAYNILLDDKGKAYHSIGWANEIEKLKSNHRGEVNIIIGGAYGVSEEVKNACQVSWSLSKLTFTHQMVRVILLEQLYRAFNIIHNTGYHHE